MKLEKSKENSFGSLQPFFISAAFLAGTNGLGKHSEALLETEH